MQLVKKNDGNIISSGEEFSTQPKKILVEEFSGENFSDKGCSNEKFSETENYPKRKIIR
jgi:hypothetical protein